MLLGAVVGVINGWARNAIGWSNTILKVYYRGSLLDVIIGAASAAERYVPPLLHRCLRHGTVVYIAVSVERRFDLSVRSRLRIVVLARI